MKEIEINDIIRIFFRYDEGLNSMIVKVIGLPEKDSFLYKGDIIIPQSFRNPGKHRVITFFSFQVLHNFGQLHENEFIEKYPEYAL